MKFLEPNIIVVDDKKEEIIGIIEHYNKLGLGCKYFNSDLFNGDERPDNTFSDVNLFFLDLFYSGQPFDEEMPANWVQSIVPEKSYYILVIWTRDNAKADSVLQQLKRVNRSPAICLVKNKTIYTSTDGYNFTQLFRDIEDELGKIVGLSEILIWKKGVRASINEILGNLTKDVTPNRVSDKLKKIIVSHGGSFIKTVDDNLRKRFVLFDALDSVLISNTKKNIATPRISDTDNENLYNLNDTISPFSDKELNSWFHFKLENSLSQNLVTPGLIALNNHRFFKKLYSIQDDPKLKKLFDHQRQGKTEIEDVVLVISRPCDIAQNKFGKNIKLLSGVSISNALRHTSGKNKNEIDFNGANLPDSIKKIEHLYFDEAKNDITFLFDFRYVFSVPEKIFINKFKNIRVFNRELLSDMQVAYSSYSSRLGITQLI